MTLKEKISKVWDNLKLALKFGELSGVETNSNFIEFWYWMKYDGMKVTVKGEEFDITKVGKLSKSVTNGETVRTVWSKMRKEMRLQDEEGDEVTTRLGCPERL